MSRRHARRHASQAAAIERALAEKGWKLTHILNTHHHADHTGGNVVRRRSLRSTAASASLTRARAPQELKARHGATVVGPAADAARIPGLDVAASHGQELSLGASAFTVLHTPGHTRGHCVFHFPAARAAFVGDTLFSLGCGRLFEGTPAQMWASLQALAALPDDTLLYCAHEYTASHARFAMTLEGGANAALVARDAAVRAARAEGKPTVPTTVALEKATNPFLRPHSPALRAALGMGPDAPDVDVFAETRRRKDTF